MIRKHPAQTPQRLWNMPFILAFSVILLSGFAMNMINSTMAKYIYSVYGNATFSGVLNAMFAVMAVLARLIAGDVSDRRGRTVVMAAGCGIFALAVFGFGIFPWAAALVIFRALQGFGYATCSTGAYAAGSDVVPKERMGEGIGYLGLGYSLAMAIGPAIALHLIHGENYTPVFFTAGGMLILGILMSLVYGRREKLPQRQETQQLPLKSRFVEKAALPAAASQLFNCLAQAAINSYIVIFADSRGISGMAAFFTFMAVSMCVSRAVFGKAGDRFGYQKVTALAALMNIIGFAILWKAGSAAMFYVAGVALGIGQGVFGPVMQSVAVQQSPDSRRGAANSTYQIANDLSNGIGSVIWGLVIDHLGYNTMLAGCIASAFLSYLLVITVVRRPRRNGTEANVV